VQIKEADYPDGNNPLRTPCYLIMNTAIDGWAETPAAADYPVQFEIDYVRYYTKGGQDAEPAESKKKKKSRNRNKGGEQSKNAEQKTQTPKEQPKTEQHKGENKGDNKGEHNKGDQPKGEHNRRNDRNRRNRQGREGKKQEKGNEA
jgi:beta-glucanase (GH16 family)